MPPRTQVRTHRSVAQRIDTSKLQGVFFSNEFTLPNPAGWYNTIKYAIQHDDTCTRLGVGRYEFPIQIYVPQPTAIENTATTPPPMIAVTNPRLKHFMRLIQFYENKDDIELQRIVVQETGLGGKGAGAVYDCGPIGDDMLRIVINLRPSVPDEEGQEGTVRKTALPTVGIRVNITSASSWLTTRNPYGVVLVSGLTNISISSGQTIPGTRNDNGTSLYIVMDVKPLRDTRLNVASRLCAQDPTKSASLIAELRQMAAGASAAQASPDVAADATAPDATPGATTEEASATGNIMNLLSDLRNMVEKNSAEQQSAQRVDAVATDN